MKHREEATKNPPLRYRGQTYWAKPVPGFGDGEALIYIIGLAPAANGGNRTGRIFTGDRSGDWLYGTLHRVGLASQATSVSKEDGMEIYHTYIGAAVRCAPPNNKPTLQEFDHCRPYLTRELQSLRRVKVIVVLGSLAYAAARKILKADHRLKSFRFPSFAHGREVVLPDGRVLLCSYHPSQQNTFTGKLTREMFLRIFQDAKRLAGIT